MGLRQRLAGGGQPWRSSHALVAIPLVLIAVITLVDLAVPADVHLGPLLVIAPAITASFAGPRLTALIGLLAVGAQAWIGLHFGVLASRNVMVQIAALAVLSAFIVFFCRVRERRREELARVRSVAEAAQAVLLRPLPHRLGPLRIASRYLAAEHEARIGGDLYAATRTGSTVRVIIGDVRGKGLAAIGEASALLGAFREAVYQYDTLPELAAALDRSVRRYFAEAAEVDGELVEHFITALLLDIPEEEPVLRLTSCGHPVPLLLRRDRAAPVAGLYPSPPLGIGPLGPADHSVHTAAFESGDTLLLFTDGVVEARDRDGRFYPLAERAAQWTGLGTEALLHHLRRDLLAHAGGHLGDDAALIALHRAAGPELGRQLGRIVHHQGHDHRAPPGA
ncbi:PP2C family protein-serine/threonine phosphatase [Kitasatospora sp. NBC_01302]|uniref:PP2C family protein-serine/threonine phosphatase n=1 Tax=Kitasatospora sp. NBC_01302 TaxID=2903575 RepID=UPI002E0D8DEA|nr:serine/threonine-protein phosphatase [Kitasatospora sp. NBC_01302]